MQPQTYLRKTQIKPLKFLQKSYRFINLLCVAILLPNSKTTEDNKNIC